MSIKDWLRISVVFELLPVAVLVIQYVLRTNWKATETGKSLALLISVAFVSLLVFLLGVEFPKSHSIEILRIMIRFAIGIALWNLVRVMQKARQDFKIHESDNTVNNTPPAGLKQT